MAPGRSARFSSYTEVVPLELLLAVALPMAAAFLFDLAWVPVAVFAIAALPAAIALHAHRFLPVPRSVVLAGAAVCLAGMLLSTMITTGVAPLPLLEIAVRSLLVLCFLFMASLIPLLDERHAGLLLLTIVLAASVNAGINAGLFLAGDPRSMNEYADRLIAVFGLPGGRWTTAVSAPYAVTVAVGFALAISASHGRWFRVLAALSVLPIGLALLLTAARSGILGAAAGCLAAVLVAPRRWHPIVFLAVVGLLVCVPVMVELGANRGASLRSDIWLEYLGWAWEQPLVGQGLIASVHRPVLGIEFHHAHNILISAWVRGGILGLAGMAMMLGGGIYWGWRYGRRTGNGVYLAAILAIAVAGMFDYELLPAITDWMWVAFWLPIGLGAGAEIALRADRLAMSEPGADGSGPRRADG